MYIAKLKQYRQCLEEYKNVRSDEVKKSVIDNKTKEVWELELGFVTEILRIIKKYERKVELL
jgi:hypothetical protein